MEYRFYKIWTHHQRFLAARLDSGLVGCGSEEREGAGEPRLVDLLLLDIGLPNGTVFICSENDADVSLNIVLSGLRGRVVPLRLKHREDGSVSLQDPSTYQYLTTLIPEGTPSFGRAEGNRSSVGGWEFYTLEAVSVSGQSFAWEIADTLHRLFETALNADRVADYLQQMPSPAGLAALDGVMPFLTTKDWSNLARKLLEAPNAVEALRDEYGKDPWAARALPDLIRWLNTRHRQSGKIVPSKRMVSPAEDSRFADVGIDGRPYSFAHALNYAFRRLTPPSRGACILACVRNEGIYLLEWIAYHRAIGFEWFFLYSNNNEDGSDEILSALSNAGVITWVDNQIEAKTAAQHKAYAHALSIAPDILDFAWVQVVDGDEFVALNPEYFSNINRLCCTNGVKADSRRETSLVAGCHEQVEAHPLPYDELVFLQRVPEKAGFTDSLV